VFRIVQEQLNNIVKHAGAQNVHISLFAKQGEFILTIRDDGKGFDAHRVRKGLGIINIQNRVELFNGKAEIFSLPGSGCQMIIRFPLPVPAPGE
jgi:signal transduction histidine kinase